TTPAPASDQSSREPGRGRADDVITETATHAGHLDATRELIDGRTWLVLS
ncbi:MAG: DUF664 domain-containing protein, partial [Acidimicrobiales bacterium]